MKVLPPTHRSFVGFDFRAFFTTAVAYASTSVHRSSSPSPSIVGSIMSFAGAYRELVGSFEPWMFSKNLVLITPVVTFMAVTSNGASSMRSCFESRLTAAFVAL